LEPWIQSSRNSRQASRSTACGRLLKACIYAGKGYIKPLPAELRQRIMRSGSRLFTRRYPASKRELYRYLSEADLLVSYDPLTSLSYEASLLGVPSFILPRWDESNFSDQFPARLDGIVWDDLQAFLRVLDNGFDHEAVLSSYRNAITRNPDVLIELLRFATSSHPPQAWSAADINSYWQSRQSFFARLNLPSPSAAWGPLSLALPPVNVFEYVQDKALVIFRRFQSLGRKASHRIRAVGRRLLNLLLPTSL